VTGFIDDFRENVDFLLPGRKVKNGSTIETPGVIS
jgi:hypothetical protein